jgi:hypothetical protein
MYAMVLPNALESGVPSVMTAELFTMPLLPRETVSVNLPSADPQNPAIQSLVKIQGAPTL